MAKVSNKTVDLISQAIIKALTPFEVRGKMLTYDKGKEFCGYALIDEAFKSTGYCQPPCELGAEVVTRSEGFATTSTVFLRQYVSKKRPMKDISNE